MLAARAPNPDNLYMYTPSALFVEAFLLLILVSLIAHISQAIRRRALFLAFTVILPCILEFLGWGGRLWSIMAAENIKQFSPWQLQHITMFIAPTILFATDFVILGHLMDKLGPVYRRLSAKTYKIVYITLTVVTTLIQCAGAFFSGGVAAKGENPVTGVKIMLAGICLKLVLMLLWAALFFDFARAYLTDKPATATEQTTAERKGAITRPIKVILFCLFVTYLAFFVRIVYRFLELTGGWEGKFHSTEIYFNMMDGAMMYLCFGLWNLCHPRVFAQTSGIERMPQSSNASDSVSVRSDEKEDIVQEENKVEEV